MKKFLLITFVLHLLSSNLRADEGMWLPLLIGKNIDEMQKMGSKLTAEDIYSVNNSSLKDAIVIFGRGCTGSLISDQGLVITNHHCGFGSIQALSSVEHDYLKHGFWATEKSQELPAPGLTVTFLIKMEDVTSKVLDGIKLETGEKDKSSIISKNIEKIVALASEGNNYRVDVRPFYYGNEYYMYVYEVYKDVRLVGAPPSAIGNFGGDTDNWVWPRHTGDFSMFRIYADKDNKPAAYSADNVPYKPKKYLEISLKGVKQDDFTMVYGYPGRTQQFVTSQAVELITDYSNPSKIALRDIRLGIMNSYMRGNDTIRIMYANKYAGVANSWKKWIGESTGLKQVKAVEKKRKLEQEFAQWVSADSKRNNMYGNLLPSFSKHYNNLKAITIANDYNSEAVQSVELLNFASTFTPLINEYLKSKMITKEVDSIKNNLLRSAKLFYKGYYLPIDKEVFANMINQFYINVPLEFHPAFLGPLAKQFGENWNVFANDVYNQSVFSDSLRLLTFLNNFDTTAITTIKNDNAYRIFLEFNYTFNSKVGRKYRTLSDSINSLYSLYVRGLREMNPEKNFYPDANSTIRISYGKVSGYSPLEAVEYSYFTTLEGIIEKGQRRVYDYVVPEGLQKLYQNKDYGRYQVNGTVPVAFIASNHTSGGNSGSPVLNRYGQLIGVNFDRGWEGTMSDVMYDSSRCRNITLDIRYALFIIDKYAGAGQLIKEMKIIE
ncbi:MAG: S46 family peptidase [Tenuifilaceae bacterium]